MKRGRLGEVTAREAAEPQKSNSSSEISKESTLRSAKVADVPAADAEVPQEQPRRSRKSNAPKAGQSMAGAKQPNGKPLVIVESPAKARTIGKFLGEDYKVVASVGHVRDLRKNQLSIDVEHDFKPRYQVPVEKKELVSQITDLAARSKKVFLATDPDREGEAIAWHLMEAANIDPARTERVVFHEITRDAVAEAFAHPREIDMDLVDAQQARRLLDRLVGYNLSPILWAKVRGRLSAGRVQSVALRLIVEREREIQAFKPVEYWTIEGVFRPDGFSQSYKAKLVKVNNEAPQLNDSVSAQTLAEELKTTDYAIDSIKANKKRYGPAAPFITSTMQQEASRKLGFQTRRTMSVAQQLYEGIDLGDGEAVGLITYMRTDSVHVAPPALQEARDFIRQKYGDAFLPEKPPVYKTRAASAQEAHEAVRPTSVLRTPDSVRAHLSPEQFKLYRLIWQRFVASQMEAAVVEITTVEISGSHAERRFLFRAADSRTVFPGFRSVYEESQEDQPEENGFVDLPLQVLQEGQTQILESISPNQHFTQPPARFSEASLIQELEKNKIGRPSTYAPIITTIQTRGYVNREEKRLAPTDVGFVVNDLLVGFFPEIVDVGFTSDLEEKLDEVASGKQQWVKVVADFYAPFEKSLAHARENMPRTKLEPEKIGRACPKCGSDLVIRTGRYGRFISCSTFPACDYTEALVIKLGIRCPVCKEGEIVERSTKRGRKFYGCSRYPDCTFSSWKKPIPQPCPNCGGLAVLAGKNQARCLDCQQVFTIEETAEHPE